MHHAEIGQVRFRVANQEIVDVVLARVHAGGERRPGRGRFRRMRRAERADAAAARRELLHVRQLALVHPFLHEAWVHAVEPEDDELLLELLRRPPRPACRRDAETDTEQGEKDAFHKSLERRNYTIWTWGEF